MLIFVIWENKIFVSVIFFFFCSRTVLDTPLYNPLFWLPFILPGRFCDPYRRPGDLVCIWETVHVGELHRWSYMLRRVHIDFAVNFQIPHWFHFSCFFKKHKVKTYHDIGGFDSLRWDDQEKIKGKVGGGGGSKSSEPAASSSGSDDLMVEYAKSSRSKCKKCKDQIDKVRLYK